MPLKFVLGINGVSVFCQLPVACLPLNFEFKASDLSFLWRTSSSQPGLLPHRTTAALTFKSPASPPSMFEFRSDCNVLPPIGQYGVDLLHPGSNHTSMTSLREWLPPTLPLANYIPITSPTRILSPRQFQRLCLLIQH